jgi:hypothetical protein
MNKKEYPCFNEKINSIYLLFKKILNMLIDLFNGKQNKSNNKIIGQSHLFVPFINLSFSIFLILI